MESNDMIPDGADDDDDDDDGQDTSWHRGLFGSRVGDGPAQI